VEEIRSELRRKEEQRRIEEVIREYLRYAGEPEEEEEGVVRKKGKIEWSKMRSFLESKRVATSIEEVEEEVVFEDIFRYVLKD
jgi:hypothetical protein